MKFISIIFFITFLIGQLPFDFSLNRATPSNLSEGLRSNAVFDIQLGPDDDLYFGTGDSLGYADITDLLSPVFYTVMDDSLPQGGIPALKTYTINEDSFMVVLSGAISTFEEADGKYHPRGSGISWSFDNGNFWHYINQPVDSGDPGSDIYFDWYGQQLKKKVWHTTVDNISYDVGVDLKNKYIYSTSWGGGLNRFNYVEENPIWEVIPLPMDDQDSLICGEINEDEYYFSPTDPPSGSFNHKPFSVYVDEDTVWVGTAGGINKGIIRSDGCINWTNFDTDNGLGGDWVIGIIPQQFDSFTRLWLLSWITPYAPHPLTFTDDGGESWKVVTQLFDMNIIVYNLSFSDENILASTDHGLYVSDFDDGIFWKLLPITADSTGERLLTEAVFSAITLVDDQEIFLIGTNDGLSIVSNSGVTLDNIRFWEPANPFSAYPNPFLINDYNQVDGDGHVRFIYSNPGDDNSSIDIFDFAMDRMTQLGTSHLVNNNESEVIWNGRNEYGDKVANGVYFCRLSLNGKYNWTKLAVVN